MKAPFAPLFTLLLAVGLHAQPPAATPAIAVIEGRVVRAGTGEPLKKAWVALSKVDARGAPRSATTDAEGKFIFDNIEPGGYRLSAGRNGYVRRQYGQRTPDSPGTTLTLAPGERLKDVHFDLIPAAVIAGRVYDEDGEPTPGVLVEAMRYGYFGGRRQLFPAGRSSTDDRGQYRIFGLEPGTYFVSATYDSQMLFLFGRGAMSERRLERQETDESYAPTYFPGTINPGAAAPLELRAGDEVSSIDFLLLPTRTVRVRGRVFNAVTGRPGRGTSVLLVPRGENQHRRSFSPWESVDEPDGSFELRGVLPGSYFLAAMWDEDNEMYSGRVSIEVGPTGLDGVAVTIEAGIEVAGRIRTDRPPRSDTEDAERTTGDQEERSRQAHDGSEMEVGLEPKERIPVPGAFRNARVKEDSSFEVRNVSTGDYWIYIGGAPPDYFLKGARMGGVDVLEKGLEIAGGRLPGQLELTISPNGARVEGVVLTEDSAPFGGAQVTLVPETRRRNRHELYRSSTTDQYGRFILRGIAPGEYKLFAWEQIERGAQADPDFMKPYEGRGQELRLREGEQAGVELKLIRTGEAQPR